MTLYYKSPYDILSQAVVEEQTCFLPFKSVLLYRAEETVVKNGKAKIYTSENYYETNDITVLALEKILSMLGYVNIKYEINYQVDDELYEECSAYKVREKLIKSRFRYNKTLYLSMLPPIVSDTVDGHDTEYMSYRIITTPTKPGLLIVRDSIDGQTSEIASLIPVNVKISDSIYLKIGNKIFIFIFDTNDQYFHTFIFDPLTNILEQDSEKTFYDEKDVKAQDRPRNAVYFAPIIYFFNGISNELLYYNTLTFQWRYKQLPINIDSIFVSGSEVIIIENVEDKSTTRRFFSIIHTPVNNDLEIIELNIKLVCNKIISVVSDGNYIIIEDIMVDSSPSDIVWRPSSETETPNYNDDIYEYLLHCYDRKRQRWDMIELSRAITDIHSLSLTLTPILLDDTGYITGKQNSIYMYVFNCPRGNCIVIDPATFKIKWLNIVYRDIILRSRY